MPETPVAASSCGVRLRKVAEWQGIRALAWEGDSLYGCRGYEIVTLQVEPHTGPGSRWNVVSHFRPAWWRGLTSRTRLGSRLCRDGFHALAILGDSPKGPSLVGAVPGAVVTCAAGDEFRVTHRIQRGTRPLHITAVPTGEIYWGEYFDNRERAAVHLYRSSDGARTWHIAYTFPAGTIRHVHNIVYDRWVDCLWILTGDEGGECKVIRASPDLRSLDVVLEGSQQTRSAALVPAEDAVYFSTDTPLDKNRVYRLDRAGKVEAVSELASSSIYGCRAGGAMLFSTMVEPSSVNLGREMHLVGSSNGGNWGVLASWRKDNLPMGFFQYGNVFLPDGRNSTRYLAATSIAVKAEDRVTTLWEVETE